MNNRKNKNNGKKWMDNGKKAKMGTDTKLSF